MRSIPYRGMLSRMHPAAAQLAEVISGEPRTIGAPAASAPAAARWLGNPTPHDASPEPGSYHWWLQLLLSWGRAFTSEDQERSAEDSGPDPGQDPSLQLDDDVPWPDTEGPRP